MSPLIRACLFLCLALLIIVNKVYSAPSQWELTLQKASKSVVSIRVNVVKAFDTESNKTTQATGFVVDSERGIILTNRHVINPGPITAEAVFSNSEEVELIPIYRDPVHDFGFFKYNPKALKFIKPESLTLIDNAAKIGDSIKVIGNDSGEHMSILSGTLARLDRSAPAYRRGGYNDFNTFYFQSAADTSGGSSGSPVFNTAGQVIALNAGANNQSSSSFFLPLYKVTRALKAIQQNRPVQRGTIEATLDYQTYAQVRRLGLPSQIEQNFRLNNRENGLLTVKSAVTAGVSDNKLRPGDIIISLSSSSQKLDYVSRYEAFEIFLDQHVGQKVQVEISRQGKSIIQELAVKDLHQITPDDYLSIGGGIFNNFSYQLARQTNLPIKGVYIASPGFMFANAGLGHGAVINQLNDISINNLADFEKALSTLSEEQFFSIRYVNIGLPMNQLLANVKYTTRWHPSSYCQRNDKTGLWPCRPLEHQQKQVNQPVHKVKFPALKDKRINKISRSLVMVEAALPYHIDGQNFPNYSGTGLIIDAESGLVAVDRNTVPVKMAQVSLTIAGVAEIPAKVVFVHPLHSYTLLQYDPQQVDSKQIKSARLYDSEINPGDKLWLVGYQTLDRLISEEVTVSYLAPLSLPPPSIPQFRENNITSLVINNPPQVASGVLLDKKGRVRAWWTNFSVGRGLNQTKDIGLPINHIIDMRKQWLANKEIHTYSLEAEVVPLSIAKATNYGLSSQWIDAYQSHGKGARPLQIKKRVAGSDAFNQLRDGDILLALEGALIEKIEDIDRRIHKPEIKLSLWRDGQQLDLSVNTKIISNADTEEIYLWAGALLQQPHRAVAAQYGIEEKGVYISWYWYGSPANRYGLEALNRIVELEGVKIDNLEQFIELSQQLKDKNYLRIRMIDLFGRETLITLKQDLFYWPTEKIFWNGERWINSLENKK